MATNYTANYGLCQWEPQDNFIREEFNQDNAKIDEALADHTVQLEQTLGRSRAIRTILTEEATDAISIDLRDIDWNEWEWVSLFVHYRANYGTESSNLIYCDLNDATVTVYCSAGEGLIHSQPNPVQLIFLPHHNASEQVRTIAVASPGGAGVGHCTFAQIKNVRIFYVRRDDGYSTQFPAGMEITIRGVK